MAGLLQVNLKGRGSASYTTVSLDAMALAAIGAILLDGQPWGQNKGSRTAVLLPQLFKTLASQWGSISL